MKIDNKSNINTQAIEEMLNDFYPFAQKRFGFDREPCLEFLSDQENSGRILGKTAFYEPSLEKISIYVDKRHPKDIMRSSSHELVHHTQNCNGELGGKHQTGEGYAQADEHLRKMEEQAYLHGNMCFRDWEDGYKRSNPLQERKERLYYELTKRLW